MAHHNKVIEDHYDTLLLTINLEHTILDAKLVSLGFWTIPEQNAVMKRRNTAEGDWIKDILDISSRSSDKFLKLLDALRETKQEHIVEELQNCHEHEKCRQFFTPQSGTSATQPSGGQITTGENQAANQVKKASSRVVLKGKQPNQVLSGANQNLFGGESSTGRWECGRYHDLLKLTSSYINQENPNRLTVLGPKIKVDIIEADCQSIEGSGIAEHPVAGFSPGAEQEKSHGTCVTSIIHRCLQDEQVKLSEFFDIALYKIGHFDTKDQYYDGLAKAFTCILGQGEGHIIALASGFFEPPAKDDIIHRLLAEIKLKNVLICAASNDGKWKLNSIAWPARESIAMGSVNEHGATADESPQGTKLLFVAPGYGMLAAGDPAGSSAGGGTFVHGTSYACAWSVGIYAHIILQIKLMLKDMSSDAQQALTRHYGAEELISRLCTIYPNRTDKEGYGIFDPYDKIYEYDLLRAEVKKALKSIDVKYS